jgi:hypothetical protein
MKPNFVLKGLMLNLETLVNMFGKQTYICKFNKVFPTIKFQTTLESWDSLNNMVRYILQSIYINYHPYTTRYILNGS